MNLMFSVAKSRWKAQVGHSLPQNLDVREVYGETDMVPFLGGRGNFREITGFKPWISSKGTALLLSTSAEDFDFLSPWAFGKGDLQ